MDQSAHTAKLESDEPDQWARTKSKQERKLVLKVDLLLMPILTIAYGLQFYDKAVLGSASVFGIIADLGLSTVQPDGKLSTLRYSTATAAFYWGYIVGVLPFALLLQRARIAKALGILVFLWGLTCLMTIFVQNFQGLVAQRFFLGLVESTVSPGFVILTNRWYKKRELAFRLGVWVSASGIFSMFSGVLNFAIGHANGALPTWKYMFIFAGSWTMLFGIILFLVLPDSIDQATRFFSEDERRMLNERIAEEQQGASDTRFHADQAIEAICDPKLYLFLLMGAAIYVTNSGVTNFGARIISSFGYSSLDALLLQIPGGAATCLSIYLVTWIVGRWRNITTYVLAVSCLFPMAGAIIIWKSDWSHPGVAVFGYTLLPIFGAPYVLVLALSAANVAGGTKKAISAGFIFIGYNIGNIIGPYFVFTPQASSHYPSLFIAVCVCLSSTIVMSFLLRGLLIYENRKKDRVQAQAVETLLQRSSFDVDGDEKVTLADLHVYARDLSDRQNPFLRYSL